MLCISVLVLYMSLYQSVWSPFEIACTEFIADPCTVYCCSLHRYSSSSPRVDSRLPLAQMFLNNSVVVIIYLDIIFSPLFLALMIHCRPWRSCCYPPILSVTPRHQHVIKSIW